jgi:hypothetical protein
MAGLNPYLVPDDTPVSANPYTGLVNTQYASTPEEQISSRTGGGLSRGWNLGMYENPATELEGQALGRYSAGDAAGGDAARASAAAMRQRGVAFARQNPTMDSVNDLSGALNYAGESVGQGLSSSLQPALYAAPAALLGSNPVGWAAGLGLGALGAYGMEKGEQAQSLMDDPTVQAKLKSGELSYQDLLDNARAKAGVNAVLESAVPGVLGGKVLTRVGKEVLDQGLASATKHVGKEVLKNSAMEGVTEGTQTLSGQVLKNQLTGEQGVDWQDIAESALQGSLAGGAMGGMHGSLEAAKRNTPGLTAGTSFEDTRRALGELVGRREVPGEDRYAASILGQTGMPKDVAAEAIRDPKIGVEWLRQNKQDTQDSIGALLDAALSQPTLATWKSKDFDYPVEITGGAQEGPDGRSYTPVRYNGKDSFAPTDELHITGGLDPAKRQQYEALRGTAFSDEFGKQLATERAQQRAGEFADQAAQILGETGKDYAEAAQARPEYADIDADEAATRTLAGFVPHGEHLPANQARALWERLKPIVLSGFRKKGGEVAVPQAVRDIWGERTDELLDRLETVYDDYSAEQNSTAAIRQAQAEARQNKLGVLGNLVNQHLTDDARRNLGPEEKRQLGADLDRLLDRGIDAKNKAAVRNHLARYFNDPTAVLDAVETFRRKDRIQGQQGREISDAEGAMQRAGLREERPDDERGTKADEEYGSDRSATYEVPSAENEAPSTLHLHTRDGVNRVYTDTAADGRDLVKRMQELQERQPNAEVRVRRLSDTPLAQDETLLSADERRTVGEAMDSEAAFKELAGKRYVIEVKPRDVLSSQPRHELGHFTQADLFRAADGAKQDAGRNWLMSPERSSFFVRLTDDTVVPNNHTERQEAGADGKAWTVRSGMVVLQDPEGVPPGRYLRVSGQRLAEIAAERGRERGRLSAESARGADKTRQDFGTGVSALLSSGLVDGEQLYAAQLKEGAQGKKLADFRLEPTEFGEGYNVVGGKSPIAAKGASESLGDSRPPSGREGLDALASRYVALRKELAGLPKGDPRRVELSVELREIEQELDQHEGLLKAIDRREELQDAARAETRKAQKADLWAQAQELSNRITRYSDARAVKRGGKDKSTSTFELGARQVKEGKQEWEGGQVKEKPAVFDVHDQWRPRDTQGEVEEMGSDAPSPESEAERMQFETTGEEKLSTLPQKELLETGKPKADPTASYAKKPFMDVSLEEDRLMNLAAGGSVAQLGVMRRQVEALSRDAATNLKKALNERLPEANRAERPGLEALRDALNARLEALDDTTWATREKALNYFSTLAQRTQDAPAQVRDRVVAGREAAEVGRIAEARQHAAEVKKWLAEKYDPVSNTVSTEKGAQDGQEQADAETRQDPAQARQEGLLSEASPEQVASEAGEAQGAKGTQDEALSTEREERSSEHGERGTSSPAQRAEAEAFIKKVTKDVEVKWHESIPGHPLANGLHKLLKDGREVIRLALSALNPLSTAHHEAMHSLFERMSASDHPAVRHAVERLTAHMLSPAAERELKALYAGKVALAQMGLKEGMTAPAVGSQAYKDMVHERLAYWFQAWMLGEVRANGTQRSFLQKVVDLLRRAVGALSDQQRIDDIMRAFAEGKMSTPGEIASALGDSERRAQALERFARAVQPTTDWLKDTFLPAVDTLRMMEDPALNHLARLMYNEVGDKAEGLGFLPATDRARNSWTGRWYHGLEGYTKQEIKKAEEILAEVAVSAKAPKPTGNANVDAIVQHNLGLMRAMHGYQREADVRILRDVEQEDGSVKQQWIPLPEVEHYWPRVWDFDRISKHMGAFVRLLLQDKYGAALDRLRGDKMSREEMAQAIANRLVNGDREGTAEDGFDLSDVEGGAKGNLEEGEGRAGYTPWAQHANSRMLDFIDYADFKDYIQHDLHATATTYISQATKRAEYARRFRYDGQVIQNAVQQATQNETARQRERFKGDEARADDVASRRIGHVVRNIMAMEGTLGAGINPRLRKALGAVQVYQNIRLLPLGLLAQVIDPAGLLVKGATLGEAWGAYKRGISEVLATWQGKQIRDDAARLAERLGTVETEVHSALLGEAFGGNWLQGSARKLNDKLFTVNGMRAWNRGIRTAATQAALRAIPEYLNDKVHGARHLAELGLRREDIQVVNGRLALTEADGLSEEQARRVTQGVYRWVNEANLRPNAANRPALASDPHFAVFYQYKSFAYTFTKTILKRMAVELKHDNAGPLTQYAALAVPAIIAVDVLKAATLNGGDLPDYMQAWGPTEFAWHGIERAGLLGIGDMALDAGAGNVGAVLGPSLNQILQSFDHSVGRDVFDAVPGLNQLRGLRPEV